MCVRGFFIFVIFIVFLVMLILVLLLMVRGSMVSAHGETFLSHNLIDGVDGEKQKK
jgi:hypothetical protein